MSVPVEHLVPAGSLFPARPADAPAASGVALPFGAALSTRPAATDSPIPVPAQLGYSESLQVSTVDGAPVVTSEYGCDLLAKKANTVEDSQVDTEETNE